MDKIWFIKNGIDIENILELNQKKKIFLYKATNLETLIFDGSEIDIIRSHPNKIKLIHNAEYFNLTISYLPATASHTFTIFFNPNKIYRFINDIQDQPNDIISDSDVYSTFEYIDDQLKELGLPFQILDLKATKDDNAIDIKTSNEYKQYSPLYHQMKAQPKTKKKSKVHLTTFYIGNKTQSTKIYDKKTQWNLENMENPIEYDLTRFELTTKHSPAIPAENYNVGLRVEQAHKKMLELFEVEVLKDDILSTIIEDLNNSKLSLQRASTSLSKKLYLFILKEHLTNLDIEIEDLIYKELDRTDKQTRSRIKRELSKLSIQDDYLANLFNEVKTKLTERSNKRPLPEYMNYRDYLNKNNIDKLSS